MQRKDVAAAQIAEKCIELSNLAARHGMDTLATILRMGTLEARAQYEAKSVSERAPSDIAHAVAGSWDWDVASNTVYATSQFAELHDIDPQIAAAGAPLALLVRAIHPLDRDSVSRAIEAAIVTGDAYEIEYRLIGKDQSIRWIRARGRCRYGASDQPLHFPGSIADITYEKRIRAA